MLFKKTMKGRVNEIDELVARRLQERRLELGITQQALANIIKVTGQQMRKYELAQNRISSGHLFYLARALQVPVSYFFDQEEGHDYLESRPELWLNGRKMSAKRGGEICPKIKGIRWHYPISMFVDYVGNQPLYFGIYVSLISLLGALGILLTSANHPVREES